MRVVIVRLEDFPARLVPAIFVGPVPIMDGEAFDETDIGLDAAPGAILPSLDVAAISRGYVRRLAGLLYVQDPGRHLVVGAADNAAIEQPAELIPGLAAIRPSAARVAVALQFHRRAIGTGGRQIAAFARVEDELHQARPFADLLAVRSQNSELARNLDDRVNIEREQRLGRPIGIDRVNIAVDTDASLPLRRIGRREVEAIFLVPKQVFGAQ